MPDRRNLSAKRPAPDLAKGRQGKRAEAVKSPKPKTPAAKPAANRAERTAERREAIIEAALDEFISRGFTATRLDDVARRAGVAKGTIYLHFKDKESMFEELVRTVIVGGLYVSLGPTVGAVITILLAEGLRIGFGTKAVGWDNLVYGVLLVMFIIFLPKGILGSILDRLKIVRKA